MLLERGELVLFTSGNHDPDAPEGEVYRPETESFRLGPDGARLAGYGAFPGGEFFRVGGLGMGFALFGAASYAATAGDRLVVGTAEGPEIRYFAPSGEMTRVVRWPDHDRRVTEEHVDELLEAVIAASPPEQVPPNPRDLFEQIPRADSMPPYEDVIATRGGRVWVGEYVIRGPPVPGVRPPARGWLVFDADGVLVATVATPEGFELHAVSGGEVYGVYTDELGVESVRVHAVDVPAPR